MTEAIAVEAQASGREMTGWELFQYRFRSWFVRNVSRRIPRLVWYGDELDVRVTFKDIGAIGGDMNRIFEVDRLFRDMGIGFDAGSGCHGRDWEWDYSLSGPISVTFKGRAERPACRTLRKPPDLKLVS